MKNIKLKINLLFFLSVFCIAILYSGCGKKDAGKKENSWEKDMNRLIDNAMPKDKEKK